jgi:sigma-B regulation protein RsbU (phosphoserine phosphatase)
VAALVLALSVLVGVLLVVTLVQVSRAQAVLEEDLNPARVALATVLAGYVDQETAQRGYILTGDPEFLQPYDDAPAQIDRDLDRLRRQLAGEPELLADVEAMVVAHERWQTTTAEPELAAADAGDRAEATRLVATGSGRMLFDRVRAAQAVADAGVADAQEAATRRADGLLDRLSVLLVVTVLSFVATTLLGAAAFSRVVLRPLAELARRSRQVADGELGRAVMTDGPREVAGLAVDVDTMRRHLLDEIDQTRRAGEALALAEPAVGALQRALATDARPRPGLDVAGRIDSAEGVLAGDFIDLVDLDDGRLVLVLGDVSGHGPEAAVVGLLLKAALHGVVGRVRPTEVLPAVRGTLADRHESFATIAAVVVDPRAGTLSWLNAGHPAPLLVPADGPTRELDPTGPLLSVVLDDATWWLGTAAFGPGDMLVMFSDGAVEARSDDGRELGSEGIERAIRSAAGLPAEDVVRRVRGAVRDHAPVVRDDVTVLVVRRLGVPV